MVDGTTMDNATFTTPWGTVATRYLRCWGDNCGRNLGDGDDKHVERRGSEAV